MAFANAVVQSTGQGCRIRSIQYWTRNSGSMLVLFACTFHVSRRLFGPRCRFLLQQASDKFLAQDILQPIALGIHEHAVHSAVYVAIRQVHQAIAAVPEAVVEGPPMDRAKVGQNRDSKRGFAACLPAYRKGSSPHATRPISDGSMSCAPFRTPTLVLFLKNSQAALMHVLLAGISLFQAELQTMEMQLAT